MKRHLHRTDRHEPASEIAAATAYAPPTGKIVARLEPVDTPSAHALLLRQWSLADVADLVALHRDGALRRWTHPVVDDEVSATRWVRDMAPRALKALTEWAITTFAGHGLERLELLHQVDNTASCRVAQKCRYCAAGATGRPTRAGPSGRAVLPMSSPSSNGLPSNTTVLDRSAMSTIQPVILTADQDVLLGFYTKLFGAEEIFRIPEEGPAFYLGLRIGDTDLGLVAKADLETGAAPRILLSIGVDDVDETLGRVTALGGSVRSGPKDMPWGQRVAHIQDPDGNPVNLTQPTPAR